MILPETGIMLETFYIWGGASLHCWFFNFDHILLSFTRSLSSKMWNKFCFGFIFIFICVLLNFHEFLCSFKLWLIWFFWAMFFLLLKYHHSNYVKRDSLSGIPKAALDSGILGKYSFTWIDVVRVVYFT